MAEPIVVTGAAGFVGSHLVRRLVRDGFEVVAVVRPSSDVWRLDDLAGAVRIVRAPLEEAPRVGRADAVAHLAATGVAPGATPRAVVEGNVLGTLGALDLAREAGAGRFLYVGSCFEYGPGTGHRETDGPSPVSDYGAAKAAGRLLAESRGRSTGLSVLSLRPFTVYGPYEAAYRLVPSLCLAAVRGRPVELTAGAQTRDLVYVDDAVEAAVRGLRSRAEGVVNVCTGVSTPVASVARLVARLAGGLELRFGALPQRPLELDELSGDVTRASEVLGWQAQTTLEEGLARTLSWFRERGAGLDAYRDGGSSR